MAIQSPSMASLVCPQVGQMSSPLTGPMGEAFFGRVTVLRTAASRIGVSFVEGRKLVSERSIGGEERLPRGTEAGRQNAVDSLSTTVGRGHNDGVGRLPSDPSRPDHETAKPTSDGTIANTW